MRDIGRLIFALAVIGSGASALALGGPHAGWRALIAAIVGILGGVALLWPGKLAKCGAIAVGVLYLIVASLGVPSILAHPQVYNGYGNVFEQLSYVAAALILFVSPRPAEAPRTSTPARIGYYLFAACVVSFALEQLFYLDATAGFVPKWIPPGQMFWAIATTAAFGLVAIALFTGLFAKLAARLNAAMIAGFGLLVWAPAIVADAKSLTNWSEGFETVAIAGAAWIVAEFLDRS